MKTVFNLEIHTPCLQFLGINLSRRPPKLMQFVRFGVVHEVLIEAHVLRKPDVEIPMGIKRVRTTIIWYKPKWPVTVASSDIDTARVK